MEKVLSQVTPSVRNKDHLYAKRISGKMTPGDGREAFDAWANHLSYLVRPSLIDETDKYRFGFSVEFVICHDMNISTTVTDNPQRFVRSQRDIIRSGISHILIQLFENGSQRGLYHRRQAVVEAGDLLFIDLIKSFDTTQSAAKVIGFMVPKERLPDAMRDRDLHGIVLRPGDAATDLLTMHLRRFAGVACTLTLRQAALAAEATILLAQAALGQVEKAEPETTKSADLDMFERAQVYIENHLTDSKLSIEMIGHDTRISRSTLYRLFQNAGGVASYIRERRLLRAYEILSNNLCPDQSVGIIGLNQGFSSEAHFSRLFMKRFGISPSETRKVAKEQLQTGSQGRMLHKTTGMTPLSVQHGIVRNNRA